MTTNDTAPRTGLHVLIGVDGSTESTAALGGALRLFGDSIGKCTIATVLDYDGGIENVPLAERERARAVLADDARVVRDSLGHEPETALLVGRPPVALVQHAREAKCDVIVVGARGHGASKVIFGSVASHLSKGCSIPVVILPPVTHGAHH